MIPEFIGMEDGPGSDSVDNQIAHSSPLPASSAEGVEVSVVIPCLNEVNSIAICVDKAIRAMREDGLRGEVVVGDNGSTDGSQEIAQRHGARLVICSERGYGAALRAAIGASRGQFIVMGDADDSYDFGEVPKFVHKGREGVE